MARTLNKKEKDLLNKLYTDKELNGRGLIRKFIVRNTYKPKYKIGDCVKITDDSYSYIWGNRIVNVKAKIVDIDWWLNDKDKEYVQYECIALDQDGHEHTLFAEESIYGYYQSRRVRGKCKDNKNVFEKKSKYSQSCSVSI